MLKTKPKIGKILTDETAAVELSADEFHRIHDKVRNVILTELGLSSEDIEEEQLADRCRLILEQGGHDENTRFDFQHGFLPLYERLRRAKKTGNDSGYRIVFA